MRRQGMYALTKNSNKIYFDCDPEPQKYNSKCQLKPQNSTYVKDLIGMDSIKGSSQLKDNFQKCFFF